MATRTGYEGANAGHVKPRLTSEQVWHALAKGSIAVVSYGTRAGEPRSSGVVYKATGRRLCIAVAPDSWKVGTTALHPDFVPASFDKQPATKNPRSMAICALGALAVATAATAARRRRVLVTESR